MAADIINLLPDAIANQIAAGEVVQRPSSVVKELLENSVDAGSTEIKLIVKDAGKSLVQVIDNGSGMTTTDARMSFERHATSKISTADDLFRIKTMGFRGEALPSISAISQMELKTRIAEEELGTYICIEGSELKKQEPTATPQGTSISVKNLFYNIPARRSFLKSNPVELRHITEEFQRVAMANPDISFSMFQNDMEVFKLEPSKLSRRIVGLLGKSYKEQLITCQEETELIQIKGYLGKPESAKKTRGDQFFFVNNRFIKNNYLNHAVVNAYEGLLPQGYYPFYTLFIDIDTTHVDINVHPTKTEVKFEDERMVYGIIKSGVKQALGAHNISPSLDFGFDVNFESAAIAISKGDKLSKDERDYSQFKKTQDPRDQSNLEHWSRLYDVAQNESTPSETDLQKEIAGSEETIKVESHLHDPITEPQEKHRPFQLHRTYLIKQVKSGMLMIHQHLAHERVLYEKFALNLKNQEGASQQSLFSRQLELNQTDFNIVSELQEEIRSLGFQFEIFGNSSISVNGIPPDCLGQDEQLLFEGLIEQFKENQKELSLDKNESLVRALAKRSAIKVGQLLSEAEMESLIDQLFACEIPNYNASGHPTFVILDHQKLQGLFSK